MLRVLLVSILILMGLAIHAEDGPIELTPVIKNNTSLPSGTVVGSNTNLQKIKLPANAKIMVIPVNDRETTKHGMIDHWQAGFIRRRYEQAKHEKVSLVILEIDTYGGEVPAGEEINKIISESGIPTIGFVNGNAFSCGAIISLGCTAIVMTPESIIGGAQVIAAIAGIPIELPSDIRAKQVSLMDNMVKALAQKNGYPENLVRGMVRREMELVETADPANRFIVIEELPPGAPKPVMLKTWKRNGDILTLTATDALNTGLCSAVCPSREALLQLLGATSSQVGVTSVTATEKFARTFVSPFYWIILLVVGMVGLIWEIKAPGHGVGYAVFGLCLAMVFWLAYFADSAGMAEIVLFGLGMALLAIEFFWIPGFGFTGFAGIACVLVALMLAFIPHGVEISNLWNDNKNPYQAEALSDALSWATLAMLCVLIGIGTMIWYAARMPGMRRMALNSSIGGHNLTLASSGGEIVPGGAMGVPQIQPTKREQSEIVPTVSTAATSQFSNLNGQKGIAETVLKPAGKVRINDVTYDASSESGWIDPGTPIYVVSVQASILHVKKS